MRSTSYTSPLDGSGGGVEGEFTVARGTKTSLLPLVLIVGALVIFVEPVRDVAEDLVGGLFASDPVIVGSGDYRLLVSGGSESDVEQCTPKAVIETKRCDDTKVVVINAGKMPFIARNIKSAWAEGQPANLTKDTPGSRAAKYRANCGSFKARFAGGSCDEYPFASTEEGGSGARTEEVPAREQDCQGGTLSTSYRYQRITTGDSFMVVISNPGSIASSGFKGADIAEDTSACGS